MAKNSEMWNSDQYATATQKNEAVDPEILGLDSDNSRKLNHVMIANIKNVFVLVKRGNCTFSQKVFNAQKAGYDGVIVYDPDHDYSLVMHADFNPSRDSIDPREIVIPSVFVGKNIAKILYDNYMFKYSDDIYKLITQPFLLMVADQSSIIDYLLPLSLILLFFLVAMMITSCMRILRQWRQNRKNRLRVTSERVPLKNAP